MPGLAQGFDRPFVGGAVNLRIGQGSRRRPRRSAAQARRQPRIIAPALLVASPSDTDTTTRDWLSLNSATSARPASLQRNARPDLLRAGHAALGQRHRQSAFGAIVRALDLARRGSGCTQGVDGGRVRSGTSRRGGSPSLRPWTTARYCEPPSSSPGSPSSRMASPCGL